ncbi:3-oxoacyl-[acyl-carrier-protein] reductase FabG-like [Centruroides vittatus]|uniref:3-oxoacyl-[acyl-carrier-protein] reductase FabG-like n=1 Tax=Centruroides vittatus TaxID=120091 RepID=UPI00350ED688
MPDLQGKVALITGASSGIGVGIAVHFAHCGCFLALNGRNVERLKTTKEKCINSGRLSENKVLLVPGDVSIPENAEKIVKETVKHFGKLDILINNAGIIRFGEATKITLKEFDEIMRVNVRAVFHMMQLCIPYLELTKGSIVNVSSIAAKRGFPNLSAYCASKAAVDQLTKSVAAEVASKKIRVNAINPGFVETDLLKNAGVPDEESQKFAKSSSNTHPLGRNGTVDDMAKAIAFLASEDSSFITGTTLPVDGGRIVLCLR